MGAKLLGAENHRSACYQEDTEEGVSNSTWVESEETQFEPY